ncbi:hypothetical protein BCR34DRAFT_571884 [Clohesyomyces aquaticus]|uniref:Uncharacterized protein n=1 Tax=Clohesyomyces aquaticus TaxID=1231657 RepID=A0A1Y1Z5L3_9PLEO|nr:hypothetical protein BCR34DRAFT_571884 [Clohesyomyces aquaticus]
MPTLRSYSIASAVVIIGYFLYGPPIITWAFGWTPVDTKPRAPVGSPGIGISLTACYGTVSIRNDDGSFEDIGRVDGDQHYLAMMERFSLPSSWHIAPPYSDLEDMWDDWGRQWLRSTRKMFFLPASSDVRKLSNLTSSLVSLARSHTTLPIASVVISYPALPGIFAEDIVDTGLYLSLPVLRGRHSYPPRTMVAAYAGHGMGLCSPYHDRERCREEDERFPMRYTLIVDYTSTSVLMHTYWMYGAVDLARPTSKRDISTYFLEDADRPLGTKRLGEMVKNLLNEKFKFLSDPPYFPKEMTVLLAGSTNDIKRDEVQEVVKGAVEEAGFEPMIFDDDPEFIASRGAAELAWRALSWPHQNTELSL